MGTSKFVGPVSLFPSPQWKDGPKLAGPGRRRDGCPQCSGPPRVVYCCFNCLICLGLFMVIQWLEDRT